MITADVFGVLFGDFNNVFWAKSDSKRIFLGGIRISMFDIGYLFGTAIVQYFSNCTQTASSISNAMLQQLLMSSRLPCSI